MPLAYILWLFIMIDRGFCWKTLPLLDAAGYQLRLAFSLFFLGFSFFCAIFKLHTYKLINCLSTMCARCMPRIFYWLPSDDTSNDNGFSGWRCRRFGILNLITNCWQTRATHKNVLTNGTKLKSQTESCCRWQQQPRLKTRSTTTNAPSVYAAYTRAYKYVCVRLYKWHST